MSEVHKHWLRHRATLDGSDTTTVTEKQTPGDAQLVTRSVSEGLKRADNVNDSLADAAGYLSSPVEMSDIELTATRSPDSAPEFGTVPTNSGGAIVERLNCRVRLLHDSRRTEEDGRDIRTVQELLGHADVSTTMVYTHVLNRPGMAVRSPLDLIA